jgi:hypothetical protein
MNLDVLFCVCDRKLDDGIRFVATSAIFIILVSETPIMVIHESTDGGEKTQEPTGWASTVYPWN